MAKPNLEGSVVKALIGVASLTLLLTLLLTGCTEPTIDASSEEAFYRSAARIMEYLPPERRDAFANALVNATMSRIDFNAYAEGRADEEFFSSISGLDGMTAGDVFAMAKQP